MDGMTGLLACWVVVCLLRQVAVEELASRVGRIVWA